MPRPANEHHADPTRTPPPTAARHGPDQVRDQRDPHTEENLDEGLQETFPASDPVSIAPGSN